VDEATPMYSLTSVSLRRGLSPSSSSTFNALSTESIGYCGTLPYSGAGGIGPRPSAQPKGPELTGAGPIRAATPWRG